MTATRQPSHSLNMIKGNSRILIVEGVDAFEMLMIVILEQLFANIWGKNTLL